MANNIGAHEVYAANVLIQAEQKSVLAPLMGAPGTQSLIVREDDLENNQGMILNIPVVSKISGDGVEGDATLEGNEAKFIAPTIQLITDYKRNAVVFTKKDQKKGPKALMNIAQNSLSNWLAKKMDELIFAEMGANLQNMLYGGDATSKATLEAADVLTLALIDKAKLELTDTLEAVPVKIGTEEYFVAFITERQQYQLRQDAEWKQAVREAEVRGKDNPIFSGAVGVYNGIIFYTTKRVPSGADAGATADLEWATALFCGAEAVAFGFSDPPTFNVQTKDYNYIKGIGTDAALGAKKVQFADENGNFKDYAIVGVMTANVKTV